MARSVTRHGAAGMAEQGSARPDRAGLGAARPSGAGKAKGNGGETTTVILPPAAADWTDVLPLPQQHVTITPPRFQRASISIEGTSPYVQHKFSEKARKIMEDRMVEGSRGKNVRRAKAPRQFEEEYEAAMHKSHDGRHGIPAPGFRSALISACRLVGFSRPMARLSIFVESDFIDAESGMPLVHLIGTPKTFAAPVRIGQTTSTVWRPMWEEWSCVLRVRWDADQFLPQDVINLIARAGGQVGVGEGRPDSKNSDGLGYGLFQVVE